MLAQVDLRHRRVLIVGAAGFLGRASAAALVAAGAEVIGVDVARADIPGVAEWITVDVLADGLPERALAQVDTLIHLAWRNDPGRGNSDMYHDAAGNVALAVRVFEQAARSGLRRILYASSGGTIYGTAPVPWSEALPMAPIGGYGAGKAAAELYLGAIGHAYDVQTCALRIANPYGPFQYPNRGQGFIATALARTLTGESIDIFGSMALSRDYIYVDDVAEAIVFACADEGRHVTLNVGSGQGRSLADLIELIFAAAGRKTEIRFTPGRPMDVPEMVLDIGRIGATLGWRPTTTITDGLAHTAAWLRTLG